MDFSTILNKPFNVGSAIWDQVDIRNHIVYFSSFPGNTLAQNNLMNAPFKLSTYSRMLGCVMIQVAGTPLHQGTLLAAVVPSGTPLVHINQLLQAPHAFLSANESTPVCVEIPYYHSSALTFYGDVYATIVVMVLNPLNPGTTGSTALTVSVQVKITQAEFYVPRVPDLTWITQCGVDLVCFKAQPRCKCDKFTLCECSGRRKSSEYETHSFYSDVIKIPTKLLDGAAAGIRTVTGDFIDACRRGVRALTGFHNPNDGTITNRMIVGFRNFPNSVDQPTMYEKLDHHTHFDRVVQGPKFGTIEDEMDINRMLSKPVLEATVSVGSDTTVGRVIFSRPITPFLEAKEINFYTPMRKMYEATKYWRGGLRMHIQASMTNFHYCRLMVVRVYDVDSNVYSKVPLMSDVSNLMSEIFEFSAGGQVQTIELPYASSDEQLDCTRCLRTNALSHGMVYIYLLTPLTSSASVATQVDFNIYFSAAEDLQFYGYSTDRLRNPLFESAFKPTLRNPTRKQITISEAYSGIKNAKNNQTYGKPTKKQQTQKITEKSILVDNDTSQVLKLLKFETHSADNKVTVETSSQEQLLEQGETEENFLRSDDYKPIINLRDIIRRLTHISTIPLPFDGSNKGVFPISIDELLSSSSVLTAMQYMTGNYHGFTGGLKFKVLMYGVASGSVRFVPPGTYSTAIGQVLPTRVGSSATNPAVFDSNSEALVGGYPCSAPVQESRVSTLPHGSGSNSPILSYEFTIPNMNPKRFLNYSNLFTNPVILPPGDMGTLLFSLTNISGESTTVRKMQVFMSFTDESRFGYQCLSQVLQVDTTISVVDPTVDLRLSVYNTSESPFALTIQTFDVPACYIGGG